MADARTPQVAPPPSTGPNTRAKGKGREDLPPPTTTRQQHLQKGKKRIASPDISDPAIDVEGEITPKTSDIPPNVPRLQVEEPSPPRPTQRARTESGILISTGEVSLPFAWPNQCSAHLIVRGCVAHASMQRTQSAGLKAVPDVSLPPVSSALCRGRRVAILPHHGHCPSLRPPMRGVRPTHLFCSFTF